MMNLVIGKDLSAIENKLLIEDFYDGLTFLESHDVKSVIINIPDDNFSDEDAMRTIKLLSKKRVPTLILSRIEKFIEFDEFDYVAVIDPYSTDEYIYNRYIEVLDYKSLFTQITTLSKQTRTIPFYLLGSLLLMEPLIKILYLKLDTGFDFNTVFEIVFSMNSLPKVFEFWFLFPLAGLALFRATAYSLFVFAGVYAYSIFAYFSYEKFSWPYVQETPHISANLLLFFNTALLVYFLIPENRKPFTNRAKYFFRKSLRISTFYKAKLRVNKELQDATILNISDTGVLLTMNRYLGAGKYIELEINGHFIQCDFVREVDSENNMLNYGLRFKFANKLEKKLVKSFISQLQVRQSISKSVA